MSAGTRSGVNCTRWNWPPIAPASAFTARVLARPGTPSTRMWPRARRATSSRSRSVSWPTMVFFTSYRICSVSMHAPLLLWAGGSRAVVAATAEGGADRHGEADTDEGAGGGRVEQGHDDADGLAAGVDQ